MKKYYALHVKTILLQPPTTLPPTTLPPTTLPPTTLPPTTLPPTTLPPTTLPPTTLPPTTLPPTTLPPTTLPPTTQPPTTLPPTTQPPTPEPICTIVNENITVTIIRNTTSYANEESFKIMDGNTGVYTQPSLSNSRTYTWSITLVTKSYTLIMTDSYGDAWSSGSSVEFKVGETSFGSYRLSSGRSTEVTLSFDPHPPLVITSDSDCERLLQNGWKSITVNEGLCNSMRGNLVISDNACLETIVIKKNSLKNLNSLVISNNPQLSSIVTEDGQGYPDYTGVGYYVKNVEISSIF